MGRISKTILLLLLITLSTGLCAEPSIQELYIEGEEFRMMNEYYRAIESYKTALQKNPSFIGPLKGLAQSYFGLGEFVEALNWVNEAVRFDQYDLDLLNLKGRIHLGLGDFAAAADLFSQVLRSEPYNIDAQFGMAELEIATGKMQNAAERYRNALRISPENRRALLSLVLLYDTLGNPDAALDFIEQALYFYSDNPQVRYIAGSHYMSVGDYDTAAIHASAALTLDEDYLDAGILYSQLAIKKGLDEEAVDILKGFLAENRDRPLLWYSLGIAYKNMGKTEEAVNAFAQASALRSGDDLARISLENLIISDLELTDPRRARYAEYHFRMGKEYDERNLLNRAYEEFRRGLQLDPFSREGRLLIGDIYRRRGLSNSYREELRIIDEMLEQTDVDISDELEFLEYRLDESVSAVWETDQFYLDREKVKLGIFFIDSRMYHQEGEEDLLKYLKNILTGYENIDILDLPVEIASFSEGYRKARESGSDYFIILDINESERMVSFESRIYMSETGGELRRWTIFRSGNQRIPDAARKLASDIQEMIPLVGRLIDRKFDDGLLSLGLSDGLSEGDEFLIIRNGELHFSKDTFGFNYDESSVLGTFTVTALDDLICEGNLEKNAFFDMINQGDYMIPSPGEGDDETADTSGDEPEEDDGKDESSEDAGTADGNPPEIYDRLLTIQ